MSSKKSSKKPRGKKAKKNSEKELNDTELEAVTGGASTDPLEDLDTRKRPGRVKSLHQTP